MDQAPNVNPKTVKHQEKTGGCLCDLEIVKNFQIEHKKHKTEKKKKMIHYTLSKLKTFAF